MLTINPRLNTLTGWELDPYGYTGNEAFPPVQVDIQNPFSSPVLPPSTKTFPSQLPPSSLSLPCDEPTNEYDLTSSSPAPVSSNASATSSTPVSSGSSPPSSSSPESDSSKPERASRNNHDRKRPANHIPRPPNAFMIYRSEFVKSREYKKILKVEKNQQMISKMLGAKWRRLPEDEKAQWRIRAKESEAEHTLKYPGYSYKPTKREEIKRRRQQKTEEEKQEHCETLMRTYMPGTIEQPIVESAAPRKRKSRAKKKAVQPERPVVTSTDSSSASATLIATFQADSQPAVGDPITNDLPPSAAPVVSETTAVSELYARYNRDKAAGMPSTTEMFNTQYMYPSFFGSQQSQFLPSSQVQVEYSASSMAPNYFSENIFQNLVLPPTDVTASSSSFPPNNANVSATISQAQAQSAENWGRIAQTISTVGAESVSMPSSGSFVNIAHMGKPVDFPVQMFSQPENQYSDMHLVEPQFISSDDLSQININLDGLDFSSFYNLEGTASAEFVQFANNEGPPGFYGFNDGGENSDIGAVQTGSGMGQETGFGALVNGNGNVVGTHMNPNPSAGLTTVQAAPNEAENQHYGATPAESQFPATVAPSEISISQNGLGNIYSFQQLDSTVTVQADSTVNHEPKFYNFDNGNSGATAYVDSVGNQDSRYGSDSVVYTNPPVYFPVQVVQPENHHHPGMNTNLIDGYGAFNDTNNVNFGNTVNFNPQAPTDFPIIVQAESHHIGVNSPADQQQMQYISMAPGHHLFEMNVGHGMHCSDPTLSGVLVPDKPPPYLYQGTLDVPTNALASGNGHGY